MVQAVIVPVRLVRGRKLPGRKANMPCRVCGKGRVPGGAVPEFLHVVIALLAVVFAKDLGSPLHRGQSRIKPIFL